MTYTLGVDPSLTGFGWCVHNPCVAGSGRVIAKGVFKTSPKMIFVRRYIYLRESMCELFDSFQDISSVGVESPPFGEQWSEGLYGLFVYVNEACYLHKKDVVYFDPISVKSLARIDPSIRKGSMKKPDMIEASRGETTIKKWNHNEADAYIIARSAARFWGYYRGAYSYEDLTVAERKAFYRIDEPKKQGGPRKEHGLILKENSRFFQFSLSGGTS